MADDADNTDDNEDSLPYKLVVSAIVIILTPGVEIVTGFAPIGTTAAFSILAGIWGLPLLDNEEEEPSTE